MPQRHNVRIEASDFTVRFGRFETAEAAEKVAKRVAKKRPKDTVTTSQWAPARKKAAKKAKKLASLAG